MPELPEVETICLQLKEKILNKKIEDVIVKDKRVIKGISSQCLQKEVKGGVIKDILRRGKVLIILLDKNKSLVVHLRISGWLILSENIEKFARVVFKLDDRRILNFCDRRVLGEIKLVEDWRTLSIIKQMGPEPLSLSKEEFIALFTSKKTKIKPLLMDQEFIAGVGNVYAQESLFCAGIHPERRVDKLKKEELEKLYSCLISILKEAIKRKGSSVDSYRQIDGKEGEYIPFLKVYQRENEACLVCKTPIKRKVIGGRGTYFCPRCQV